MIGTARQFAEPLHRLPHGLWDGVVEQVGCLASLEENVRVLRRATQHWPIGIHRPVAVSSNQIVVDHRADIIGRKLSDLVNFVRRAESIEKVYERDARSKRCRLSDQRQIMSFLNRIRRQHCPAGLTHCHHVAVIAEDRKRVRRPCAGRDVKDRWQ